MVYVFNRSDDVSQYTSAKLIVKWFVENPGKKYKSQQEIAEAISKKFPAGRTQSAISKAFKSLLDCEFTYMSRTYAITKYDGHYVLVDGEQLAESLKRRMLEKKLFKKKVVFYERGLRQPQMFTFWIEDEKMDEAKAYFEKIVGLDNCCDIFDYQDKLFIMLDPNSARFTVKVELLKNFFTTYRR